MSALGGALSAQQVLPAMISNKKGTIIFTGNLSIFSSSFSVIHSSLNHHPDALHRVGATASLRGSVNYAGISQGKFALRAIAQVIIYLSSLFPLSHLSLF